MCLMNVLINPCQMATPQEKAQCVSWFIETKLDVQTQRKYRNKYERDPPSRPSIHRWHKKFIKTRSVLDTVRSRRPRISGKLRLLLRSSHFARVY